MTAPIDVEDVTAVEVGHLGGGDDLALLVAATQLYERGALVRDRPSGPARLRTAPEAPVPVEPVERAVAAVAAPGVDGPRLLDAGRRRPELADLRRRLVAAGLLRPGDALGRGRRGAQVMAVVGAGSFVLAAGLVWVSPWVAVALGALGTLAVSLGALGTRSHGPRTPAGHEMLVAAAAAWADHHTGGQRVAVVGPGAVAAAAPGLAGALGLLPGRTHWPTSREVLDRSVRAGRSKRLSPGADAAVAFRDY